VAADAWSAGVLAYELMTGTLPFGDASTSLYTVRGHSFVLHTVFTG
jgi:hypothetical protein